MNSTERIKESVKVLLKNNPQGLTIEELSSRAKLNRNQIRAILKGLLSDKVIIQRVVGQAKLNYWDYKKGL